jgi:hypothetical protein
MKFAEREKWRQSLPAELQDKLKHEEQRISDIRKRFSRDKKKNDLLGNVRASFVEWRNARINFLKEQPEDVRRASSKFVRTPLDPRHNVRHKLEGEIDDVEEPLHEFRAGVMHFEKTGIGAASGWRGTDFKYESVYGEELYSEKFPNQKIRMEDFLNHQDHNPFAVEPDRLKYFHFPANHMGWIEVCPHGHDVRDTPKLTRDYDRKQ